MPSRACVGCVAALAVLVLLVPGCSSDIAPGATTTNCSGATLTPGPCNEPFSLEPEPILPENRCPTPTEVDEIQSEVPISVSADATQGTLACRADQGSVDLTPAQAALVRGLLFMRRVRFDAPLPFTTQTLWDWVRSRIPNGIVLIASGNSHACLSCRGPIYIAWNPGQRTVGVDVVSAAFIITHETRHTEGIRHNCKPVEPYGDTLDRTIADLGAMGADYYVRQWIATHSDEHPDAREYARRSAARLRRSFCCECPQQTFASLRPQFSVAEWLLPPSRRRVAGCAG